MEISPFGSRPYVAKSTTNWRTQEGVESIRILVPDPPFKVSVPGPPMSLSLQNPKTKSRIKI